MRSTADSTRTTAASRSATREPDPEPTVKRLLYVLRTTSTGIHLLRAGELVIDLTQLADEMRLRDVDELVERKRAGEQASVTAELVSAWSPRIDRLFEDLDAARDASPTGRGPNEGELDSWLVELRRGSARVTRAVAHGLRRARAGRIGAQRARGRWSAPGGGSQVSWPCSQNSGVVPGAGPDVARCPRSLLACR
ncbi:MAG: nucleotidyltransferase domain-containing protein [Deltaproteobacteria bacterium]|nr:nucleotidyltransferase domain-containing protein [Deltaproteobacteria bacterium]